MTTLPPGLLQEIAKALEEEEMDVYTLTLYSMSRDDMNFFSEEARKKVLAIFQTLIRDTREHAELLRLIVEMGSR